MNKRLILIISVMLFAGIIGAFLGSVLVEDPGDFRPKNLLPDDLPDDYPIEDMRPDPTDRDNYISLKSGLTMINMALSAILIFIYLGIYKETKSEFTMSLIIVMMALFLYAFLSNPIIPMIFGYRVFGMGLFTILPDIFTALALAILLYVSSE